jgi:hypothetical protein
MTNDTIPEYHGRIEAKLALMGAGGGFSKEPSAIFSKEIGHFIWQLL